MTKKEAKEIMCKVTFYWELGEQTLTQNQINEALDLAIKALEQTRWIPCTERLPKVADCYDVTRQIGSDLIVSACYFDGINWHNGNRISYERNYLTNVVAWMPRPEPYKESEEECR